MNKKNLSNEALLEILKTKAKEERQLTLDIIELLQEVASRDMHLKMGYGSLLKFCVEELKYSESAAYRRIQAIKFVSAVPETRKLLLEGEVTLQAVTQAQVFLNQEKKYFRKLYSCEQKLELANQIKNKNTREVEKLLAEKSPELPRPEISRQITEKIREVRLTITEDLQSKLDFMKNRYSHKNPNPTLSELLELMASELIDIEKIKIAKAESRFSGDRTKSRTSSPHPRSISNTKRYHIRLRDGGVCSYKDPVSGRKCGSRHQLEIDHIRPVWMGGGSELENLRLVCRAHNQALSRESMGG